MKIVRLLKKSVSGASNSEDISKILHDIYKSKSYQNTAEIIAQRFVTMGNTIDAKTWREAALGGGVNPEFIKLLNKNINGHIGTAVQQQVTKNAQYIKTLPLDVAEQVTDFVKTNVYKSTRASEIAKLLQSKVDRYSKAKAGLIARTEASKAMTALTEARARDVGVKWYQWRTADDARVRNSHDHMEGVLVNWDNPPSPEELAGEKNVGHYNAGNIYNCRCYPSPLVTLNRVQWPAKVYYQGKIQTMSREQFEKIA